MTSRRHHQKGVTNCRIKSKSIAAVTPIKTFLLYCNHKFYFYFYFRHQLNVIFEMNDRVEEADMKMTLKSSFTYILADDEASRSSQEEDNDSIISSTRV